MSAGVNRVDVLDKIERDQVVDVDLCLEHAPLHEKLEIGRVVRLRAFTPFRDTAGFEPPIVRARLEDRDILPRQ
jgi:hypothetical protein